MRLGTGLGTAMYYRVPDAGVAARALAALGPHLRRVGGKRGGELLAELNNLAY